jgi:hypothetical protein
LGVDRSKNRGFAGLRLGLRFGFSIMSACFSVRRTVSWLAGRKQTRRKSCEIRRTP